MHDNDHITDTSPTRRRPWARAAVGLTAAGVLLLGCCCLGSVGSWFFFLRSTPEKTIIGKWGFDAEAFKKNAKNKDAAELLGPMLSQMQLEIKSDNTMSFSMGGMSKSGKWKVVKTEGNTVFLDTKEDGSTKDEWTRQEITVIDSNHLKAVDRSGKLKDDEAMYLKRL